MFKVGTEWMMGLTFFIFSSIHLSTLPHLHPFIDLPTNLPSHPSSSSNHHAGNSCTSCTSTSMTSGAIWLSSTPTSSGTVGGPSFIHPSIHSFIHPFIHSSIHSFIHTFIHSSIHSFFIIHSIRFFLPHPIHHFFFPFIFPFSNYPF